MKESSGFVFLALLIFSHFYIRSHLSGRWAYPIPNNSIGTRAVMNFGPDGHGTIGLDGNVLANLTSALVSMPTFDYGQYGPVLVLTANGKSHYGLCLPIGNTLYVLDSDGVSQFTRADAK